MTILNAPPNAPLSMCTAVSTRSGSCEPRLGIMILLAGEGRSLKLVGMNTAGPGVADEHDVLGAEGERTRRPHFVRSAADAVSAQSAPITRIAVDSASLI